jgi:hypothetical protein
VNDPIEFTPNDSLGKYKSFYFYNSELNRIANILFKPYLVALVLTAGIYMLSPFPIDKYKVDLTGSDYHYESKVLFS